MTGNQRPSATCRSVNHAFPVSLRWVSLGFFVLIAGASLFLSGPQIQVDEGSYLLSAATIAGKIRINGVYGYYSGYSLALVPAFWLASDPKSIYHLALLINALLIAATPLALYRLTRRLYPQIAEGWHVAAAAAATCHSSVLLMSQHTMSENVLIPLYAGLLAACASMLSDRRVVSGIATGCIGGMLFLVHPRGGAMAGAVLAMTTLCGLSRKDWRRPLLAMWIAMFAIAAAHFPVEHLAGKPMRLAAGYAPNAVIHHLAEPGAWKWVVLNLAGSTTEAVVASFGMLVVALIAVCAEARSWRATFAASAPRATVLLSAAAGLFIALLMSAIFFVPPQRPDHIAYGRYALPAVLPFVAIGVLQFARGEGRYRRDMFLAVATGLACVALMAYAFTRLPANIASGWNYINAPFLYLAQNYLSFVSAWWAVAACFGVGALAVGVATWKSGRVAIAVFTLTGLAVAAIGWRSQTWHLSRLYSEHRHVIEAANAFEGITGTALCINLARQMVGWHGVDFRWRLLDHMADYRGLDDKPCVHAKVDHLKDGALDSPMRLVATERPPPSMNESVGLFVEPGPALEAWNRRMPAVATDSFYPIPESDRRAEVALLQPSAPVRSRVGSSVTLTVRVTNKSARRWAHIQDGPYPVWLGARAFEGEATLGEYRARFDHDVAPGESVDVDIAIGPFRKPGTFRINVGVLQEHVAWFPDRIDLLADVRP